MTYFDLNIPYTDIGTLTKPSPDATAKRNTRLKLAVKAMELGYSGVAYNRSMKGVMSEADRCFITPFPLASLLKAAPSLSTSATFHRKRLGVSLNSPFRQYSRLTVSVDSSAQAATLNSGNSVIKSYDLVAVRPLNQQAFDNACKVSEVDLIAIDFSEKLPFRLKLPMVKAAIERGIYFEIMYSRLISDIQTRRQMVTNAKLLVDWTHGKNIILSSAAASVNELRGPHDAANLSFLLGLSMERAKAAISKNCRSLLANALRKKQFFKGTIKVERILSAKPLDSKDPWFVDARGWDNISSGEGDLLLDDIAKSFSACSEVPKTSKAIDFASIVEEMPSNGMKLKDWLVDGGKFQSPNDPSPIGSIAKDLGESPYTSKVSELSNCSEAVPFEDSVEGNRLLDDIGKSLSACSTVSKSSVAIDFASIMPSNGMKLKDWLVDGGKLQSPNDTSPIVTVAKNLGRSPNTKKIPELSDSSEAVLSEDRMALGSTPLEHEIPDCQDLESLPQEDDILAVFAPSEEMGAPTTFCEEPKSSDVASVAVGITLNDTPDDSNAFLTPVADIETSPCNVDPTGSFNVFEVSSSKDHVSSSGSGLVFPVDISENSTPSKEIGKSFASNESSIHGSHDVVMGEAFNNTKDRDPTNLVLAGCEMSLDGDYANTRLLGQYRDGVDSLTDEELSEELYHEMQEATTFADKVAPQEASFESQNQRQGDRTRIQHRSLNNLKQGKKARFKQRKSVGAFPFPFKRLAMPLFFPKRNLKKSRRR